MILLYNTYNRSMAILLSFIMNVQNSRFTNNIGITVKPQNIGTISLIKGAGHFNGFYKNSFNGKKESTKLYISLLEIDNLKYSTKGFKKNRLLSYGIASGIIMVGFTAVSIYSLGAAISGSSNWGVN